MGSPSLRVIVSVRERFVCECSPCAWLPGAGAVRTAGTLSGTESFPSSGHGGHLGCTAGYTWAKRETRLQCHVVSKFPKDLTLLNVN